VANREEPNEEKEFIVTIFKALFKDKTYWICTLQFVCMNLPIFFIQISYALFLKQ